MHVQHCGSRSWGQLSSAEIHSQDTVISANSSFKGFGWWWCGFTPVAELHFNDLKNTQHVGAGVSTSYRPFTPDLSL
eukprot:CAMPEP_0181233858 /NCGR_PEP_ID=MMETSP1096-20121128/36598_1 /TAXON_ID=156174 ORGANISM="Chrysochromulina ericina, Strain CCMP281" /NCGR_SAMPLE_ID=MMETSP1096 /ASSEMBLY_ACC=CAM_ASM_000453 /LENGTH=76 /DNA_ID=CAMNT_0023328463 /DNA_START=49 /DNA_END=279 /DNA_ORIENTATION=-